MNPLQIENEIPSILSQINFWTDNTNKSESIAKNIQFWNKQKQEMENGKFWIDQIKNTNDYTQKLVIALDSIPLLGAFNSAVLALRKIIRDKRKAKSPYAVELSIMYWLAAIKSLYVPYSEILQEPGFNVLSRITGKEIRSLLINYNEVGYEKLELLNKTDVKLLIENFGEPHSHNTLNVLYSDLWHKYEIELKAEKDNDLKDFLAMLGNID